MSIYQTNGGWSINGGIRFGDVHITRKWLDTELSLYIIPADLFVTAEGYEGDNIVVKWYRDGNLIETASNENYEGILPHWFTHYPTLEHPKALGTYSYTCDIYCNGVFEKTMGPYTLNVVEKIDRGTRTIVPDSDGAKYRKGDEATPITFEVKVTDGCVAINWRCAKINSNGSLEDIKMGTEYLSYRYSTHNFSMTPSTDSPGTYLYSIDVCSYVENDNYFATNSTTSDIIEIIVLPPFDLPSFQLGIAAGLGLNGWGYVHEGKVEPIAYLYNGVRMPPLPEWDREMYPYAVIGDVLGKTALLVVQEKPYYSAQTDYIILPGNSILYSTSLGEWGTYGEASDRRFKGGLLRWTSHDVIYADSTEVYFEASEPIPVYE